MAAVLTLTRHNLPDLSMIHHPSRTCWLQQGFLYHVDNMPTLHSRSKRLLARFAGTRLEVGWLTGCIGISHTS